MVSTRRRSYKEGEEPASDSAAEETASAAGPARSTRARTVSVTSDSDSESQVAGRGKPRRRASSESMASPSPSRSGAGTQRKSLLTRRRDEKSLPSVAEEKEELARDSGDDTLVIDVGDSEDAQDDTEKKKENGNSAVADIPSDVEVATHSASPVTDAVKTTPERGGTDEMSAEKEDVSEGTETRAAEATDSRTKTKDDDRETETTADDVKLGTAKCLPKDMDDSADVDMHPVVGDRQSDEADMDCTEVDVANVTEPTNAEQQNRTTESSDTETQNRTAAAPADLTALTPADKQRQKSAGTRPVQLSDNGVQRNNDARSKNSAAGDALTRVKCRPVPRGKPKSGRFWKPLHTKFSQAIVRNRDSFEVRMKKNQQMRVAKDLENQIKAEHKVNMEDLRRRREYNAKKAKENALKAEVYQVVKNPNKIKRMKKKQLRQLVTRDTTVVGKSVLDD